MTTKPGCSPHGWTLDSLEAVLVARLTALEKMLDEREARSMERFAVARDAVNVAMTSAEKAVTKAEQATEKRFDSVNEFRATLADQAALLMPRSEYTVQHQSLVEKVDLAIKRLAEIEARSTGKKEGVASIGAVTIGRVSAFAALISLIALGFNIWK